MVSWNGGTPKSPILVGFFPINHQFLGTLVLGNPYLLSIKVFQLSEKALIFTDSQDCQTPMVARRGRCTSRSIGLLIQLGPHLEFPLTGNMWSFWGRSEPYVAEFGVCHMMINFGDDIPKEANLLVIHSEFAASQLCFFCCSSRGTAIRWWRSSCPCQSQRRPRLGRPKFGLLKGMLREL